MYKSVFIVTENHVKKLTSNQLLIQNVNMAEIRIDHERKVVVLKTWKAKRLVRRYQKLYPGYRVVWFANVQRKKQ